MMRIPALCILFIVLFSVGLGAASTTPNVIRSVANSPDSSMGVTLDIQGIDVGGITEELPAGYEFVESTHPQNRTTVLVDNRVCFAVLGEKTIEYTIRNGDTEMVEIQGTWEDFGNGLSGMVFESNAGTTSSPTSPVPTSTPQSGIWAAIPLLAAVAGFALLRRRVE